MFRRISTIVLVAALTLASASCTTPPPKDDGKGTAAALVKALNSHTAAGVTFDVPTAQVQSDLDALSKGIDPVWPKVTLDAVTLGENDDATVALNYSWSIPNVDKAWIYKTKASMNRKGEGWSVKWTPAMLESKLNPGDSLKLVTSFGKRASIMDASNMPIVKDRPVQVVGINKDGLSEAEAALSAKALAGVVGVDAAAFAEKVKAYGPVAFVDAITLREEAAAKLDQGKLKAIKGYLAQPGTLPLAPSRTFAAPILGGVHEATAEDIDKSKGKVVAGQIVGSNGLQASFDAQLAGSPGVKILALPSAAPAATSSADPTGQASEHATDAASDAAKPSTELFALNATDGLNLKTTLVQKMQTDAENALAKVKTPSAVVVMKPSTGAILAAANGPDSNGYNTAFVGQYAPGSTFKIATGLGLFRTGLNQDSKLPCTEQYISDGKKFLNAPGYAADALGNVSMTTAIAHSCNTAFVSQEKRLPQGKLAEAANALGIGQSNNLGLEAFMGTVPADSAGTEHAASMIGQGKVQVSPLAMATMMATVVKGSVVSPVIVQGHDGKAKAKSAPALTSKEAQGLRTMMRAVVTDGYLNSLGELPGAPAIGKTGTAEFGTANPPHTHSWVIAAQGDLAVAVFVEDGDLGAVTAGPIAKQMLRDAALAK